MISAKTLFVLAGICLVVAVARHPLNPAPASEEKAQRNKIRCFEHMEGDVALENQISERKYDYCCFHVNPDSFTKNGILTGEEATPLIDKLFDEEIEDVFTACRGEAIDFGFIDIRFYCYCKEDLCNVPTNISAYIQHSKLAYLRNHKSKYSSIH
ncbi:unnamed protein product [Caenorhabditis sp. 36 PRJEB53466]|nr:unnamed protein product [Caenorhabditis sp. 36 PRJEB53466]